MNQFIKKNLELFSLGFLAVLIIPVAAMAIQAPNDTGAFGYDLYDIAVNGMLKGPIGFVGGLTAIVLSAINITKNWMLAAGGILGGTALLKADTIVSTMGMLITQVM
jgi:hypothetical protein